MSAIPIHIPVSTTKRRVRKSAIAKARARDRVLIRTFAFTAIAGATYLASSLAGNVMLEQARSEGKKAMRTTEAALELQATLQRQVIALTSERKINAWARINGFVATDYGTQTSGRDSRVAFNR